MRLLAQLFLGLLGAPLAIAAAILVRGWILQLLGHDPHAPLGDVAVMALGVCAVLGAFYGVFLGSRLTAREPPVQFSLRNLMLATIWLALWFVAIGFALPRGRFAGTEPDPFVTVLHWFALASLPFAAIGALTGRTLAGLIIGAAAGFAFLWLWPLFF
jgi:hypothetical protein